MGRPKIIRWPGLEAVTQDPITSICLRQQELELAEKEASDREREYSEMFQKVNGRDVTIDLYNLKFDCGGAGHTTIDFDAWSDQVDPTVTLTTSDFKIYNRCKKLIFTQEEPRDLVQGVDIVDLKFNQTYTAVFFVTIRGPLSILRKIFNKYI